MLYAQIDLGAIRENARRLLDQVGEAEAVGVVKANAYGHGAVLVARALAEEGVRRFAVATVPEGIELRQAGLNGEVLVLGAPLAEALGAYRQHGLSIVVASVETAEAVAERLGASAPPVHVKVDTGMHRLGVPPEATASIVRRLRAAGVPVEAVWTHFATADADDPAFVETQARRFVDALDSLGADAPPFLHVANGPTAVRPGVLPDALRARLTGAGTLARLGGVLYGLASDDAVRQRMDALGLRPAMRLVTRVVHLQTVATGESVSYGRAWTAQRPTRIATLAAGYADGIPRALSNAGEVGIGGRLVPVAGRVCMDMTLADLGPPDGPAAAVRVGDEAVVFGRGGPTAEAAAARAGTISYEMTCGLTARVERVQTGS